jgi:hypothetical protein
MNKGVEMDRTGQKKTVAEFPTHIIRDELEIARKRRQSEKIRRGFRIYCFFGATAGFVSLLLRLF